MANQVILDNQQLAEEVKKILAEDIDSSEPKFVKTYQTLPEEKPFYDIYFPQPLITSPGQLSQEETFERFNLLVKELIRSDYEEEAFKLTILLDELLYQKSQGLRSQDPQLFQKYEKLLALCNYLAITALNLNEIEQLVKGHTVWASKNKIDVREKLDKVLEYYYDRMMDGEIAKKISLAMNSSLELIGDQELLDSSDGKGQPPTLKNWLNDYIIFSRVPLGEQRSSFQRINYMQKAPNAIRLAKTDRNLLYNLIKIFDWLNYGDENVPINEKSIFSQEGYAPQVEIKQHNELEEIPPQNQIAQGDRFYGSRPPAISPALTRPPSQVKPPVKYEEISRGKPQVELEEIQPGKGLSFGGGQEGIPNVKFPIPKSPPPKPVAPSPQGRIMNDGLRILDKKKEEIDKKLEELRKRSKNKPNAG